MTTDTPAKWQRKQAALRDLILLLFTQLEGHALKDDTGHMSATILGLCGLPDNETNRGNVTSVLKRLEQEETIARVTRSGGKRTYEVVLMQAPSEGRIDEIQKNRDRFVKMFEVPPTTESSPTPDIEQLLIDSGRAYEALRSAASQATRREAGTGYVVLSGRGVLSSVGINTKWGREIRYYLRLLGLARGIRRCNDGTPLWWWKVSDQPLDPKALEELATGELSYANYRATLNGGKPQEGDLTDDQCGPVTVRQKGDPVPTTPDAVSAPQGGQPASVGDDVDPVDALLKIVERLVREKKAAAAAHALEIADKDRQIADLERAMVERGRVDDRVRQVIYLYGDKGE